MQNNMGVCYLVSYLHFNRRNTGIQVGPYKKKIWSPKWGGIYTISFSYQYKVVLKKSINKNLNKN